MGSSVSIHLIDDYWHISQLPTQWLHSDDSDHGDGAL